jgi:hypothetical protein
MPLALYTEMTRQTQATKGMTGGSPMERGLIAAMAAEEERKKKLAEEARKAAAFSAQGAANIAAANSTYEAEAKALPPAAPAAPGFRATTPSGAFAENFGYGAAPVASPAAPGFRATTPSGAFAENFGYGAAPVVAAPTGAKDSRKTLGKDKTKKVVNPRGVLSYRVHSNDTLESIASTFGTTPDKIREFNRKPANAKFAPNEEILIPSVGAVSL